MIVKNNKKGMWEDRMGEALATKPGDQSPVLGLIWWNTRTGFGKLPTDLYTHAMASTCTHICTQVRKFIFTKFKELEIMSVIYLTQNGGILFELKNCDR